MKASFLLLPILLIFLPFTSVFVTTNNGISATNGSIFGGSASILDPTGYGNLSANVSRSTNFDTTLHPKFASLPVTSGSISLDRSIRLLNHDSFTDLVNNLHIRGEFENISPVGIKQVHVIGTIYDSKSNTLGKFLSLTYPNDIDAGGKGRFELLVMSGTVPLDRIDHYTLQFDFH